MSDSSAISARRLFNSRQSKAGDKVVEPEENPPLPAIVPEGPRKLIRPPMPTGAARNRLPARVLSLSPLQPTYKQQASASRRESSHAEAFYFQKQIHSQTVMVFVLEQGEEIEGQIEWYDRDAIKVRHGNLRTLIYKSGIKYLYKAADKGL